MKTFDPLPFWARSITGADDDPNSPPGGGNGDPSGGSGNGDNSSNSNSDPVDVSALVGGILSQLQTAQTDDEKKQLQKDLAEAQKVIDAQEQKSLTEQQKAARNAERRAQAAEAKAAQGDAAVAFAKQIGTRHAIENFADKDGKQKYKWIDTDVIFALLDHSKVEIDFGTGATKGLEEQLDDIAKKKPHLLAAAQQGQQPPPAGQQPPVTGQFGGPFTGTIGTPPGNGNSGDGHGKKTMQDYARDPAYRSTFGRLAGIGTMPGYAVEPDPRFAQQQ